MLSPWRIAQALAALLVLLAACTDPMTSGPDAFANNETDPNRHDANICPQAQRREDGGCCPLGTFYAFATDSCVDVGPSACRGVLPGKPKDCVPRWCARLRDGEGKSCTEGPDCLPRGERCPVDNPAPPSSCPAGEWRRPGADTCEPAGTIRNEDGSIRFAADKPIGALELMPSIPELRPLPKLEDTRFCRDETGAHICRPGEKGCGPGQVPDASDKGNCVPVGAGMLCPPGFLPGPATETGLPACLPDAASCTSDPWTGFKLADNHLHVDASAKPGGDGSKDKPFATINAAMKAAKTSQTIAVHPGDYNENIAITKSVAIIGRCAAQVRLFGKAGKAAVDISGGTANHQVIVAGMHIAANDMGVRIFSTMHVVLRGLDVFAARHTGINIVGAPVKLEHSQVRGTEAGFNNSSGVGLAVLGGARCDATRVRVTRSRTGNVYVEGNGTRLRGRRLLVDSCRPSAIHQGVGHGMVAAAKGRIELISARIAYNRDIGLSVYDGGSVAARGLLVDHTREQKSDGKWGIGVLVATGAKLALYGARLHRNRMLGLDLGDPGSEFVGAGVLIDGTRNQASNNGRGEAMRVLDGAKATVRSARLSGNLTGGLTVQKPGSMAVFSDLLVDGTRPSALSGDRSPGVLLFEGGRLTLQRARVTDNTGTGVVVADMGSFLDASDVWIDRTRPGSDPKKSPGFGLAAAKGGRLVVRRARISENRGAGILATNTGSHIDARDVVVDQTENPSADTVVGQGVSATAGATIELAAARLFRNRVTGLYAHGEGSRITAVGLRVDATQPAKLDHAGGMGAVGYKKGVLRLSGSALIDNGHVGLMLYQQTQPTDIVGVVVDGTKPALVKLTKCGPNEQTYVHGTGASVFDATGTIRFIACRFSNNHTVAVHLNKVRAQVVDSLIHTTGASWFEPIGEAGAAAACQQASDGIVAHDCPNVVVDRCVLASQKRSGVLFDGVASGRVERTFATGASYGMVLQSSGKVTVKDVLFSGNKQSIANDAGLQVPAPPPIVGVD